MKSQTRYELSDMVEWEIRRVKSEAELTQEQWKKIDSIELAKQIVDKVFERLELEAYIPCCHASGTHEPTHFEEAKYICERQKAEAYENLCKRLGINPVVRSKIECGWCKEYPYMRKGEGTKLFNIRKDEKK